MEESERDEFGSCLACGGLIESNADRSYSFGAGNELCSACAIARGGQYCADRDVWDPPPDVSGIRDEDYGSSRPTRRV